jgi:aminoglycoside 2''-phosphotransferase
VPVPEWRIPAGEPQFPHGAIGYRKLAGAHPSGPSQQLAAGVAEFLAALHSIPAGEIPELPAAPPSLEGFEAARRWVVPHLQKLLDPAEYRRVCEWWDELLADRAMLASQPVVRHGDPWYGNLLADEDGKLTAVLDWHGIALGDAAWDFAAQRELGRRFFDDVLRRYVEGRGEDSTLEHRALRLSEHREFGGVRLAAALGDEGELADAVRKLRAGPVLRGCR